MKPELQKTVSAFIKAEFADVIASKVGAGFDLEDFNLHPFTAVALASGIFGELTPEKMARALAYPKVLGTSISTTFGDKIQKLCVAHLGAKASAIPGMDIEFIDQVEHKEVLAQLKAGPNTLNSGDVEPIIQKFLDAYRLLKTNHAVSTPTFAICVSYGSAGRLSGHYKNIAATQVAGQTGVPIYIGQDFWHRLTGDPHFYVDLVGIFIDVFEKENHSEGLDKAIGEFAKEIEARYFTDGKFDPMKI